MASLRTFDQLKDLVSFFVVENPNHNITIEELADAYGETKERVIQAFGSVVGGDEIVWMLDPIEDAGTVTLGDLVFRLTSVTEQRETERQT